MARRNDAAESRLKSSPPSGLNPTDKLQEAASSSIPNPSPAPSKELLSPLVAQIMESSTSMDSGGGSSSFSLAPSIVSKASTLSAHSLSIKRDKISNAEAACVSTNENASAASISNSHGNEIDDNDGPSSVPGYITATSTVLSAETIFTPRKKELHFFSNVFRRDFERWLNDDDEDEDSDEDDDSDMQDEIIPGHTEFVGRTSFVQRNGSYRKSHEMGALLFAETLHADLYDSDSDGMSD